MRGERDRGCRAVLPCPFFLQIFTELHSASSTVCVCVCVCWALGRHLADVCVGRMLNEQMKNKPEVLEIHGHPVFLSSMKGFVFAALLCSPCSLPNRPPTPPPRPPLIPASSLLPLTF